jgi:nucleoside-diphosphate-sugar epimerase
VTRIVILGATGNVGIAVLRRLARSADSYDVVAIARNPPSPPPRLNFDGGDRLSVRWQAADITSDELVSRFQGADAVVHLAWRFHPARDARQTWRDNVLGSERVFDAVLRADVPTLVYASSVGAYSPRSQTKGGANEAVDESWPTHALPTAAYGRQKSYVERLLDSYELRTDVRVVRIRSAFVFQHQAAPEQRRIFAGPFIPGRLVRSLPLLPLPRGLSIQTVAADDLAAAYEAALTREVRGAFNIAATPVLNATELANVFGARVIEVPPGLARRGLAALYHLRLVPTEPGLLELALSLPTMDTSRARGELGWRPASSAIQALESFLAGLVEPAGGPTPRLDAHAGGPFRIREFGSGVGAAE